MVYICEKMIEIRKNLLESIIRKEKKIKEVKEILWVSRKTVSKRLSQYKAFWIEWIIPKKTWPKWWESWNKTEEHIEDLVVKIAKENPFDWPVSLWYLLEEEYDINMNQSTIYRILKRKWIRYHRWYHNLKKKKKLYVKDIPWREIQLDVSFPYWYERDIFVYGAIDDCSRYVHSEVYEKHTVEIAIEFVKDLIKKAPFKILAIRTDQWHEFSKKFTEFLKKEWIEHKKNAPYTPQHNGKIERYHGTWKRRDVYYRKRDLSLDEIRYLNKLWLYHYNYKRRHTGLWMNSKTPAQKLMQFIGDNYYLSTRKNVTLMLQQNKIWQK